MLAEITPAAATCCTASSRVKAGMGQAKRASGQIQGLNT